MTNPFEDPDRHYLVLLNEAGEHSLWPESLTVPAGWETVFGAADRQSCLEYVDRPEAGRLT
jgi:MbtH protein